MVQLPARHWNWKVKPFYMHYSQIFTGQTTRNFLEKKLSCILIHIHKPLCYEDMCFPQQKLVLHWLSLHKLNWTIQTLFLYKNPANMGPSQVICSRSTTKWITLKLQANFSGILWSFPGVEAESFESWYSWFLCFCLNDSWLLQEYDLDQSRFV